MIIFDFTGKYFFLSNYYPCGITFISDGKYFPTTRAAFCSAEAVFQACKSINKETFESFTTVTPSIAKRMGRALTLRPDWEIVKDDIMYEIVFQKFIQNPVLRMKLLATDDAYLVEGNTWNDCYWGVCKGQGKNRLGEILMRVREELKEY